MHFSILFGLVTRSFQPLFGLSASPAGLLVKVVLLSLLLPVISVCETVPTAGLAVNSAVISAQAEQSVDSPRQRVLEILARVPLIDGHNDVPWQYHEEAKNRLDAIDFRDTTELGMHTDLARLEQSGIGGQFWSVYVPSSFAGPGCSKAVFEQIDIVHRLVERYPDALELALMADDIVRIHKSGRVASLIGMEGGHAIEDSLAILRQLYRAGARYMTLTHSTNIAWADSATATPTHNGLTEFGKEVVREMNRMGMIVDLSHVSPKTMHDALDIARAPVLFSHSSAKAVTAHPRNVPDDVLDRLPENGGVVMVTFVPSFVSARLTEHSRTEKAERKRLAAELQDEEEINRLLGEWRKSNPAPRASLSDVADHIDHIRKRIGSDHIGIGSDFDGISSVPVGLEDVSKMPDLFVELLKRGYSDEEVAKIAGLNVLRVMREVERKAAILARDTFASDAGIAELDGHPPRVGKKPAPKND